MEGSNGVSAFKAWAVVSPSNPPLDLIDTVYPNKVLDYWLSRFLVERSTLLQAGSGQELVRMELRDIQLYVLQTYGVVAPSLYDLPHIGK